MEEILLFLFANICYLIKGVKRIENYFPFIMNIFFSLLLFNLTLHTQVEVYLYIGSAYYIFTVLTLMIPNWSFLIFLIISDFKVNCQLLFYRIAITKKFCPQMVEKAIILLNMTGRYKNALAINNKLLKVKKTTKILNHKLYSLLKIKDYQQANKVVDEILVHNHTNSYYLTIKADISFCLNSYDEALIYYEKVLFFKPNTIEIIYNIAKASFELGYFEKSELNLKRVLSLNPLFIPAYIMLIKLYLKQGLKEQAMNVLNDITEKVPEQSSELKSELSKLFNNAEQL